MMMVHASESSRLLVNTASEEDSSPLQPQQRAAISCPPPKHLCLPSKAAILILLWTAIVGALYNILMGFAAVEELDGSRINSRISIYEPLPYTILAFIMMFYPLSGFIADVGCGRFKTVVISLIVLFLCLIILLIGTTIGETVTANIDHALRYDKVPSVSIGILLFLLLFAFIIGLAGYQTSFIQLGLDQLFEAPSRYLVLFIHYAIWAFQSGLLSLILTIFFLRCSDHRSNHKIIIIAVTLLFSMIIILLLIGCLKRKWFHIEPGRQNHYKTVYNIINFAKSHKHPLRRSAFTHNDDHIPSRLDFAKERFGGPFSMEQVENVKTFLWMLVILSAIGPSFALEVPASYFTFLLFGLHLATKPA